MYGTGLGSGYALVVPTLLRVRAMRVLAMRPFLPTGSDIGYATTGLCCYQVIDARLPDVKPARGARPRTQMRKPTAPVHFVPDTRVFAFDFALCSAACEIKRPQPQPRYPSVYLLPTSASTSSRTTTRSAMASTVTEALAGVGAVFTGTAARLAAFQVGVWLLVGGGLVATMAR
eukprot:3836493-Rhodomonas_salina.1